METNIRNKCKAYTSLEQSKKLAEFLPIESADMFYPFVLPRISNKIEHNPNALNPFKGLEYYNLGYTYHNDKKPLSLEEFCIPCWSLAALLNVLPDYSLQSSLYGTVFVVSDIKKPMVSGDYDNPVDACVEMIIKLNELNLL